MVNVPFLPGRRLASTLGDTTHSLVALGRAGLLHPAQMLTSGAGMLKWGASLASAYEAARLRRPYDLAVVDDWGPCTFDDLHRVSDSLAAGLMAEGLTAEDRVGILCRNSRGFVIAALATAKLGADTVYLNTAAAGSQLDAVLAVEEVTFVIHDEEFAVESVRSAPVVPVKGSSWWFPTVSETEHLSWSPPSLRPKLPVLMTSGTTGQPKGARRGTPRLNIASATALLQRVPYRSGDTIATSSPLFHAWGAAQLMLAGSLGATLILRQRFDATECLADIEAHRVNIWATVPVFVHAMLNQPDSERTLRRLRAVSCSGSALPTPTGARWLADVGPTIYNIYGSTEVGQATIASPEHLRLHPGTVGPPAPGCTVRVVDEDRLPVPAETSGAIFVGSGMGFEQYSDGTGKESLGDLLATGDTGYFTPDGCLMVTGRDDDMLITGGENVFPQEIEDCIRSHPSVHDAAVVGIPDEIYGHRLVAIVVPESPGFDEAETTADLQNLVRAELATYMVPRSVLYLSSLPTNPAGKLLRRSLATKAQELLESAD